MSADNPGREELIRQVVTGEPCDHAKDFKKKYAMIDDLVNYVLGNNELQQMYNNTDTFASGFTPNMGKLVINLLVHCRENETFMEQMRKTVVECQDVPEGRTACSNVTDTAYEYVRLIEGEDLIFYFGFFAVICELCSRFSDNEEFMTSLKNVAKATLFVYWNNTLQLDELDLFAKNNLATSKEKFTSNFSTVVDYLYKSKEETD